MSDFPSSAPPTSRAHELVKEMGLRVWTHRGSEGVNVLDEKQMEALVEAGCTSRAYAPEAIGNPERVAWEVILPRLYPPLEAVADDG